MWVIESDAYRGHYPNWRFQLGGETYRTKDLPSRVDAIREALAQDPSFEFTPALRFPERRLAAMHPYQRFIKRICAGITCDEEQVYPDLFPGAGAGLPAKMDSPLWAGLYCTDAVTPLMRHTYAAARGSAECALTGAQAVREGQRAAYALCRPSGHHAGPRVFGGYCYFNNTALAVELLAESGRVATLDLDYHHGNGTQEFFYQRRDVFTASIHGDPAVEYPYFWGYRGEKGQGEGHGKNLNLPLPLKTGDEAYLAALERACAAIKRFAPDYLVVACGVDTYRDDPIGGFSLTLKAYPRIGARLRRLGLPTLFCQEGGYRIKAIGRCVRGLLLGFEAR